MKFLKIVLKCNSDHRLIYMRVLQLFTTAIRMGKVLYGFFL